MSNYLKYLEKYEEKENEVIFYLKDYPSSKISGDKIVRELYIFFFHDEALQLDRVHKIEELTYKIQKEQKFFCLNCKAAIFFEEDSNYITMCEKCYYKNTIDSTPDDVSGKILGLTQKVNEIDYSTQYCYPSIAITDIDIEFLPKDLKEAVYFYFEKPGEFTRQHYFNIYHNIYELNIANITAKIRKLEVKKKLASFFKKNLIK